MIEIGRPRVHVWLFVVSILSVSPVLLAPRLNRLPIAALILPALIVNRWRTGRFVPATRVNALLAALLIMVALSVVATFSIELSLGKIAGTLLGVLLFFGVLAIVDRPGRLLGATIAFVVAGALLGTVALTMTRWKDTVPLISELNRFFPARFQQIVGRDEGLHPNPVGGMILLFAPLAGIAAVRLRPWRPRAAAAERATAEDWWQAPVFVAALCAFAFFAGLLALSQSRSAWLGAVVAGAFWLAVNGRRRRWIAALGLAAALVVVAAAVTPRAHLGALRPIVIGLVGPVRAEGRLEIWSRAAYAIQDFPVTGVGMNTFRQVIYTLYPLYVLGPSFDIASAHNLVLQTALDVGLPGLVAFLALQVAVAVLLWRAWHDARDPNGRWIAEGLLCGMVAQIVYNLTDCIPLGSKIGHFWWLAAGLAVALDRLGSGQADRREVRAAELLLWWLVASLAAIVLVGWSRPAGIGAAIAGAGWLGWLTARHAASRTADHTATVTPASSTATSSRQTRST